MKYIYESMKCMNNTNLGSPAHTLRYVNKAINSPTNSKFTARKYHRITQLNDTIQLGQGMEKSHERALAKNIVNYQKPLFNPVRNISTGVDNSRTKDSTNIYLILAALAGSYILYNTLTGKVVNAEETNNIDQVGEVYIDDLARHMRQINERLATIEDTKQAVFVCGDSRTGKSTLIKYLTGEELVAVKQENSTEYVIEPKNKSASDINISHKAISETKIPTIARDLYNSELIYVDTPGFEDTQGVNADIENTFFTNSFFNAMDSVKIIAVIDESRLNNVQYFRDFMIKLHRMFKKEESLAENITIVISKAQRIENHRLALEKMINEDTNTATKEHKEFLNNIVKKARIEKFEVPKPARDPSSVWNFLYSNPIEVTQKNKEDILLAIKKTRYIEAPKVPNVFSGDSARKIEHATASVDKQIQVWMNEMTNDVKYCIRSADPNLSDLKLVSNTLKETIEIMRQSASGVYGSNKEIIEAFDTKVINNILNTIGNTNSTEIQKKLADIKDLIKKYEDVFANVRTSNKDGTNDKPIFMNTATHITFFLTNTTINIRKMIAGKENDQKTLDVLAKQEKENDEKYQELIKKHKYETNNLSYSDIGKVAGTTIFGPGAGTYIGWSLGAILDNMIRDFR